MRKPVHILIATITALLYVAVVAVAQEPEYADVLANEAVRQHRPSPKCPESQPDCEGALLPKVINGSVAKAGAFPWVVSIGSSGATGFNGHKCGGTLISDRFVLTAAHCFLDTARPEHFRVQAGTVTLGSYKDKAGVKRILIDPRFDRATNFADIALLEMKVPFVASPEIGWIGVQDEQTFVSSGHEAEGRSVTYTLTGYGSTWNSGMASDRLMFSNNIPSLTSAICRDLVYWTKPVFGDAMKDDMICAGDTNNVAGSDACRGDSGGGLIHFLGPLSPLVAGVASRGASKDGKFDCTQQPFRVGVYTRVSAYSERVKACMTGNDPCDFVAPGHQQSASNN